MRDTRTLKGFLLSLLLHLLIFLPFFISFEDIKFTPPPSSKQDKKITLNLSQFTPPAPQSKPRPKVTPPQQKIVPTPPLTPPKPTERTAEKKPEVKPQPPLSVAKKKIVEKKKGFKVAQKSKEENSVTKVVKREPKKAEKKRRVKKEPKKSIPKKRKVAKKKRVPKSFRLPKKHSRDKLANALLGGSGRSRARSRAANTGRPGPLIEQLYGKAFYSFTKTQQKFIEDHLSEIHRITQNTLYLNGYPDVAIRTHQQGVNVVSFYLHPDGSISQLRLIKPMGYEALDNNTIAVIQIAYKDYPHPKTKTKILFYVNYRLY